jgi:hypothetical protein
MKWLRGDGEMGWEEGWGAYVSREGGFDERYGCRQVAGMSRLSPDASC